MLMNWGICNISKREELPDGMIHLTGKIDEADMEFKKIQKKLTWLSADPAHLVEIDLVELDHMITKQKIEEEDNVADLVNPNSRMVTTAYAESSMAKLP